MTRYLLLTIGDNPDWYRQAAWAIATLLAHAPEPHEILILTDRPERYAWLGDRVRCHVVDPATLAAWKGPHGFFWRVDLEGMRLAARLEPVPERIVYVDADTAATGDLAPLLARIDGGAIAMHLREYALGDRRNAGERKLARAVLGQTAGGVVITPATAMWNNGVTAIHARDFPVLDRALAALDDLMGRGIQSFYLAQLTLSMAAEGTGRLIEAAPWFVHYWANKPGWTRAIADRLADHFISGTGVSGAGADALIAAARTDPIALPLDTRARGWRRWVRRLANCPC